MRFRDITQRVVKIKEKPFFIKRIVAVYRFVSIKVNLKEIGKQCVLVPQLIKINVTTLG